MVSGSLRGAHIIPVIMVQGTVRVSVFFQSITHILDPCIQLLLWTSVYIVLFGRVPLCHIVVGGHFFRDALSRGPVEMGLTSSKTGDPFRCHREQVFPTVGNKGSMLIRRSTSFRSCRASAATTTNAISAFHIKADRWLTFFSDIGGHRAYHRLGWALDRTR